ncbi:unnamed protein product [Durusdinium trenchii]|uniref:SAP domain-containing protein n=1 Tax=Durusdinium trenchii TaxID=1381693 RepID=A0ABP0R2G0_9DINO
MKCDLCWKHGPPVSWDRGAAPAIPSTKEGLLTSLQAHGAADVGGLNKIELRHHFCSLIRGRQSPSDPTKGMSNMTKASLEVRLKEHGIDGAESESRRTRGSLMAALRDHWLEQCRLAEAGDTQTAPDEPTAQQEWELVSGADAAVKQVAIAQVQDAMEQVREASAALHELMMGTDPSVQACIADNVNALNNFCRSMDRLIGGQKASD